MQRSVSPHPLLDGMTPEQINVVREELQKAARGEYGFHDLMQGGREGGLRKDATNNIGVTTSLGLLGVPLGVPAAYLYPVITPLRNKIAREVDGGASYTFRKITAINSTGIWPSVAEASDSATGRNSRFGTNEANTTLNFKSMEMENLLTPEAQFGSNSRITPGQDFRAEDFARLSLLQVTFLGEEAMLLGGNITALANTNMTPVTTGLTQTATGLGSLTAGTNYVIAITALTQQGLAAGSTGHASADALGETSAAVATTIATAAGGQPGDTSIAMTWPAKRGAAAYNVYAKITSGTPTYQATVYTNYYNLTIIGASTNVPNTVDKSGNALDYDGLIAMAEAAGSGYFKAIAPTATGAGTLTSDGMGGVKELDDAFKSLYDTYKIGVDEVWVNTAQKREITQITTQSSAPIYRIDAMAGNMSITGSLDVSDVANRYMPGKPKVPVTVHPNMPPGTILLVNYALGPYFPNAGPAAGANLKVVLGWDYRSITFGPVKRAVEMGMDLNGVLVNYAPFALGAIVCCG